MDNRGLIILLFVAGVWSAKKRDTEVEIVTEYSLGSCGESICEPSYGNLLIGREKNLTASSTCGTKGQEKYCVVSHLDKDRPNNQKARTFKNCFICDSRQPYSVDNKKSHLIENVLQTKELDKNKWWQSKYGEHSVYVQFDLEAEFHFLYLHFQCKTLLPAAMLVERSNNFGRTWRVDRYFSEDCERDFPRVPTYSNDFRVPYCTNEFSESPNKLNREVLLTILPPDFKDSNPYREEILDILRMTNIRINFTRLHMLGDQYLSLDAKRNYYYTIYNMVVRGRCSCYGHSNKCIPLPWQKNITDAVFGQCECTHHTTGYNCERCEDFYQDLPWRPRSSDNLNECKRCECHNHSNKCHFDPAIFILSHNKSGGVCDDCQHNTMGQNCEICKANYYRNPRVSINHPDACIHCDCDPRGSEVLGGCEGTGDAELGMEAGRCNCKKFVTGHRCDTCLPGYWNLNERNPHGCEPCACNVYGTVADHQCEYQAGECRCKRFVTGRTCDSCLPGYWNFGRDEEGCTACNCDIGGAYDSQCNARTGQCRCRPNIIGQHCNHVARDHYYAFLDWLLYEAEEASERGKAQVIYKDRLSGGGYVTWTGVGYTKVMGGSSLTFVVDNIPHSMEYDFLLRHDSKQVLHPWEGLKMTIERSGRASERSGCANTTPQDYNKVFTIQPDTTHSFVRPGTCLEKGVRYTITFKFPAQRYALDGKESHIFIDSLVLLPGSTCHPLNQKPEVYEQFKRQRCMETYYSPVRQFRESDICRRLVFSSSVAIHDGAKSCDCDLHGSFSPSCEVAGGQCKCKPNVIGRRCDKCAPGFYGLTYTGCIACDCHSHGSMSPVCDQRTGQCPCNTNSFGLKCSSCQRGFWGFPNCRRCSCNGRADECDQVTGQCIGCRSNSGGPYCDGCADGYYGDLKTGCQRCPCEHGGSCRWDPRSNQVVCDCPTGYTGPRCDRCAENFYGDPTYPGGTCQMCKCNNNIDPAVPGSCDSHTGQCTKCLYNTEGGSCERCKAGYYGDALNQNCKACVCNVLGTHAHLRNDCDRVTGQCHCLSNVFGRSCDQCGENFWKLADGRGCEPCNCDPYGSLSQKCNDIDGQCECRRDFGGRQCNQCAENFWGDPRSTCKECMCNVGGSVSQQCDRHTGACTCNPGVTGHLCDRCARGTTGSLPHCKPCGPCYDGWLKLIGDITIDLLTLVEQSRGHHGGGGSSNTFFREIQEMTVKLDEIAGIVDHFERDSGSSSSTDEFKNLLKIIWEIKSKLAAYRNDMGDIDQSNKQNTDDVTRIRNRLRDIKFTLSEYERFAYEIIRNSTSIIEHNVEGAYNSIKESYRISEEAWSQVIGPCHGTRSSSERTRNEAESILESKRYEIEHGGGGSGSVDVHHELKIFTDFIRDANQKVCGAKYDNCGVCGGAGCNSCGGRISCHESCVDRFSNAFNKTVEAKVILDRKKQDVENENEELLKLLSACDMNSRDISSIIIQIREMKAHTTDGLHSVYDEMEKLLRDGSKAEEVENLLRRTMRLDIPYTDVEIRKMADLILKAKINISNAEFIVASTKNTILEVGHLRKKASEVKNSSETINIRINKVRDLLNSVDGKHARIIDELPRLRRRFDEVQHLLNSATSSIKDSKEEIGKHETNIYNFSPSMTKIRTQADTNQQHITTLQKQLEILRKAKEDLIELMEHLNGKYDKMNIMMQKNPQITSDVRKKVDHIKTKSNSIKSVFTQWNTFLTRWKSGFDQRVVTLNDLIKIAEFYVNDMAKIVGTIREKHIYHLTCGTS